MKAIHPSKNLFFMTFSKTANRTHSPHSLRNNLREEKLHGAHIGNIILSFAGDTRYFRIVYTFCFIARDLGAFVNCLRHHFWRQSLPSLVTFSHGNPTKKDTSKINSLNIIIDQLEKRVNTKRKFKYYRQSES